MQYSVNIILVLLASGIVCASSILFLNRFADAFRLVDKPSSRKNHSGNVPVVGGVSIFIAVIFSVSLFYRDAWVAPLLMMGAVLVCLGVADDILNLSARIRMPIQMLVALILVYFGGMNIESIGSITGSEAVYLAGWKSAAFTVMCTVGVINSINMIDGVDGLSGSVILITTVPLSGLSWVSGEFHIVVLLACFQIALLVFLFFNARFVRDKALVFLGDAGSMLFGMLIVWLLIKLSQGGGAVLSPIAAGWIFGLPLVDTVSVMVKRIMDRRSPFDADRNHLHHRLLDAGLSVNQCVALMSLIHAVFITVGILCNVFLTLEPVFFWLFVTIVVVYHFLGVHFIRFAGLQLKVYRKAIDV